MQSPAERRKKIETRFPSWEPLTLAGALDRAAKEYPDLPLIITEKHSWSYADVQAWSRRIASGMIALGLQRGDHVALDMANYPEFTAIKFAIARAGCVCVPCNFLLRGRELAYVLEQSDARMLIVMDQFRGHNYIADLVRPDNIEHLVVFPTGETSNRPEFSLADLEAAATAESDAELERRESQAEPDGLSDIIYTSGTTGRSKGVMLTHEMVLRAAFSSAITRAFEDGRRIQFAMPMYHVFGYVECLIAVLFVGGAIIPHIVFDPAEMLEMAERHQTSEMICVPIMTHKLIDLAKANGFDGRHLISMFNSGGVNAPSVWPDIRNHLKAREVLTAYGMTETTASTTCTLPEGDDQYLLSSNGCHKPPSIAGDPALGGKVAQYKVIDPETGADLPPDTEGELVVKGPIVTKGYYKKPEETAAAFTEDGWLHTGDVGRLTADGYLSLTGRIKETYRCGGEMVMPREIEELFDDHPTIAQALVVGIPDPKMGEVGCLCIVPRATERPDASDLIGFCAERLARFKVPKHVVYLLADEIPLTVTGRPQKFKLAKIVADRIVA
jgi:fatty-acyl-CoA synthase